MASPGKVHEGLHMDCVCRVWQAYLTESDTMHKAKLSNFSNAGVRNVGSSLYCSSFSKSGYSNAMSCTEIVRGHSRLSQCNCAVSTSRCSQPLGIGRGAHRAGADLSLDTPRECLEWPVWFAARQCLFVSEVRTADNW